MSTAAILSYSVRARYDNAYKKGALSRRVYDLLCYPIAGGNKDIMQRSSSIVTPFISQMGISANTISETTDITPQTLLDGTATLTPTSRADAIQDSELLLLQSYTDYAAKRHEIVGENMMATIEALNMDYSLCASQVIRTAARASLDAGTTTHYLQDSEFFKAGNMLKEMRCPSAVSADGGALPSGHIAIVPPDAYVDLVSGGNVVSIAQYQDMGILFNGELGELNGFRIVVSPYAKVFGGAGAANTTSLGDADVLSAAGAALDKTLSITTGTNAASGRYITVGTEETGSTLYPENERVNHISGTTTSVIVGRADNGGLLYDHATTDVAKNCDSVYPVLYGGPMSVAKAYASDVGEFGQVVGPKLDGIVDQFVSLGWKWYGGFAVINENWLVRGEYSCSLDNI